MINNQTKNISSQCQVVFFNWVNNIPNATMSISDLSDSNPIDISKYVREVSFTKNLSSPAGTFSITLPNDRDWKATLQRGSWGIIYMSQNGGLSIPTSTDVPDMTKLSTQTSSIRGIVLIDRVAARGNTGTERGEFDVEFVVTGRDFGVVYEENTIFFNKLYSEGLFQSTLDSQLRSAGIKSVDNLLKFFHEGFFSPSDISNHLENQGSLVKNTPVQWLLPQKLFQALGIQPRNNSPYYGNIPGLLDGIEQTYCSYPVESPMTLVNGNAWERLKSYSIQQFHELFPETTDEGLPQLNFRYIPWKTSHGRRLGKLNNLVTAFVDLDRVELQTIDIVGWELGEDTHSRYNYFISVVDTAMYSDANSLTSFNDRSPGTGFPRININSIRRYGLRLMYTTLNALIQVGSEKIDPLLLTLHNELMVEYHNNEIFMENGTLTMIGYPDVKLGKTLHFDTNAPYNAGKLFYIEGYTDTFISDEKGAGFWTQELILTRGIVPGSISKPQPYTDNGEFTGNG